MADFLFDGTNKLITEPVGAGDTTFDVGRDLYSAWKRWIKTGTGANFDEAFIVEGGTPIGATGLFTGATIILVNGWKVKGAAHDHALTLTGNLFSDDGIISVPTTGSSVLIQVVSSTAAQGIATGSSALTASQATQLAELHQINALDAANPVTMPKSAGSLTTGTIDITVTDGGTEHTLTRQ